MHRALIATTRPGGRRRVVRVRALEKTTVTVFRAAIGRVYDSTGGVAWPHVESRYTVAASPSTDGCGTSAGAGAGTGTTSTGHGAR
jgi:hypothetical protein